MHRNFYSVPYDSEFASKSIEEQDKYMQEYIAKYPNENFNFVIQKINPTLRLKYIDYYDFNLSGGITDLIQDITDEELIYNLLKHSINQKSYVFDYNFIIGLVPPKYREQYVNELYEKYPDEQLLYVHDISSLLNNMNEYEKYSFIKNTLLPKCLKKEEILPYDFLEIIENVNEEEKMFSIYDYLVKNYFKGSKVSYVDFERIVNLFYTRGFDYTRIIKYGLENNLIDHNRLEYRMFINGLKPEIRVNAIEIMINAPIYKIMIKEDSFYEMINILNKEQTEYLYVKYAIEKRKYNYTYPLDNYSFSDSVDSVFYATTLFKHLSKNELDIEFNWINRVLQSSPYIERCKDIPDEFIMEYSERYQIPFDRLKEYFNKFGILIIKNIGTKEFNKLASFNDEETNKLFNLFTDETIKFDKNNINDVVNSLLQRCFMLEDTITYNIFHIVERYTQIKYKEGIEWVIELIEQSIDLNEYLEKYHKTKEQLINDILNNDLTIMHELTDKFIMKKREEYIKNNLPTINLSLDLEKVIKRDVYKKNLINMGATNLKYVARQLKFNSFNEEQINLLKDSRLLNELINYKNNPTEYELSYEKKKSLKTLSEILDIFYDSGAELYKFVPTDSSDALTNYEFVQKKFSPDFLTDILYELKASGVKEVLDDEELYNSLYKLLTKYKLIGWDSTYNQLLSSADIAFDSSTIASIISNYKEISKRTDEKSTLTSILDYGNCFASSSELYKYLFGLEDYALISSNSGKNKSPMSKQDRLNKCAMLIKDMYKIDKQSLPPLDEVININSSKSIEIEVGNRASMMNLTMGERTESCLRCGGAFDDLYNFCIKDPNGFHIVLKNPNTGKIISRVSGIRNGNTIFLNELRDSLDPIYSNNDLYVAIKEFANILIEQSKDSDIPIENVIITPDFALKNHMNETIDLHMDNTRNRILYNLSFNIARQGILLASTNEGKLAPYKFTEDNPKYDTLRPIPTKYTGNFAKERIVQLYLINNLLNNVEPNMEIKDNIPDDIKYIISGEDYYIMVRPNNIEVFKLDSRKDNERTISEINEVLNNIKNNIYGDNLGGPKL